MTRQRDYRDRDYDFDDRPPYRERPPSNRRPARRYDYDDEYEEYPDRGRPYPKRPVNREYRGEPNRRPSERRQPPRGPQRPMPDRYRNPRPARSADYDTYDRPQARPRPQRPRPDPRERGYGEPSPIQQAKKKTNSKIFSFIYNLFFYTLTIGLILSSVMFAFSEKSDAAILGHRFYKVLTDSMAPQADSPSGGFYAGDIVIVKLMSGTEVKEGDVVTFRVGDGERYLTHRMVERLDELSGVPGDYIVTKGDANNSNDPPIPAERVCGKVAFVIPKVGSLLAFVQENVWLCLVCALSTFGFFLVLKAYFIKPEEPIQPVSYSRGV